MDGCQGGEEGPSRTVIGEGKRGFGHREEGDERHCYAFPEAFVRKKEIEEKPRNRSI